MDSQGEGTLPMTAMLAWAKATNENIVVVGTGGEKFPWPVREGETTREFPMEQIGFDAIAVLEQVCQVFNVSSTPALDMSGVDVHKAMNIPESVVNQRKCEPFGLQGHDDLATTPFFRDAFIMQMPMVTLSTVPDGDYQWFPFCVPKDDRVSAALTACQNKTSLDLMGMWQDVDGRFVLLFEFLKPAKAGKFNEPVLSNIELYCFRLSGSVESGLFVPSHTLQREAVGWANQAEEGFHLGHFRVLCGLYAVEHGLHRP